MPVVCGSDQRKRQAGQASRPRDPVENIGQINRNNIIKRIVITPSYRKVEKSEKTNWGLDS